MLDTTKLMAEDGQTDGQTQLYPPPLFKVNDNIYFYSNCLNIFNCMFNIHVVWIEVLATARPCIIINNFHKSWFIFWKRKVKQKYENSYMYENLRELVMCFFIKTIISNLSFSFFNLIICKSIIPQLCIWNCSWYKAFLSFENSLQK